MIREIGLLTLLVFGRALVWGWKFCSSMIHELDILLALGRAEWGAPRVRSFLW